MCFHIVKNVLRLCDDWDTFRARSGLFCNCYRVNILSVVDSLVWAIDTFEIVYIFYLNSFGWLQGLRPLRGNLNFFHFLFKRG